MQTASYFSLVYYIICWSIFKRYFSSFLDDASKGLKWDRDIFSHFLWKGLARGDFPWPWTSSSLTFVWSSDSQTLFHNFERSKATDARISFHNFNKLGAIQIICDTLGGGSTKCHMNFFCLLNSDLKAFRSKKSSLR